MENEQTNKSVKKWVILLLLPTITLVLVALAQIMVRFVFEGSVEVDQAGIGAQSSSSSLEAIINALAFFVGIVAVIGILLTPVWLVKLVRDLKGHDRSKTVAVVLAVFFSFFAWIYTYEKNHKKFWINLVLSFVTAGVWSVVAWFWAVIDNASKSEEYYTGYNAVQPSNNYAPDNYPLDNQNSPE
jgi:hypothetical protein